MNRPDPRNEATVVVRRQALVGPVLSRVIGMLAARADAPVDRLDDVMLVSDAIAAHGPAHSGDSGSFKVFIRTTEQELHLRIGPLAQHGAGALLAAADLPGVGNIVEQVATSVTVEPDGSGGESLVILVSLSS
jgi:serine/threonine-protein kinase RsbW